MINRTKRHTIQFIRGSLLLILLLFPSVCFGQTTDISDEIVLGLNYKSVILKAHPEVKGTREDVLAQTVFQRLMSTSISRFAPPLPYKVTVINDDMINAFAAPGGQVYIPIGMARLLGEDEGLWAAVLGHEIGHNIGRHHYKAHLRQAQLQAQIEYYRRRAEMGDSSAKWALLGLNVAGNIINLKLSRNEEHEADRLGLMMMVEAGYHPAFAISLYSKLRARLGDESKFGAFFSDHPRWATREDHTFKVYEEASAIFDSKWPDSASSPGGRPPVIANLTQIHATQNKENKTVQIQVAYNVRHGKGRRVEVIAIFLFKKKLVPAILPGYQGRDGNLIGTELIVPKTENENGLITITVPSAALGIKDRNLKAAVFLGHSSELLDSSKEINVSFPKP